MIQKSPQSILDSIAQDHLSTEKDLLPRIHYQLQRKAQNLMNPKLKLAWVIALVFLGLALISTVGYALYHFFFDPGLQGVQDTGLVTRLEATSLPTLKPQVTLNPTLQPAAEVQVTRVSQDVTVTLDWVYLDSMDQAFGFTAQGLTENMTFGIPKIFFESVSPQQYRGATLTLHQTDQVVQGMFLISQLVREGVVDEKVNLSIDLPLNFYQDGEETTLRTFHFDLTQQPISSVQGIVRADTYAVRTNGIPMWLDYLRLTDSDTTARLCYELPEAGLGWLPAEASITFGTNWEFGAEETAASYTTVVEREADGTRCVQVHFAGNPQSADTYFRMTIGSLVSENSAERINGPWIYIIELPYESSIPGRKEPTPQPVVSEQQINNLKATLSWAYADASRLAMEVQFSGWEEGFTLMDIPFKSASGTELGIAYGNNFNPNDPSTYLILFTPYDPAVLQTDQIDFSLDIPVYLSPDFDAPFASFHFDVSLPVYPELTFEPKQMVSVNGIEIWLEKMTMSPSYTTLYLCYPKPTYGDFSDWVTSYTSTAQVAGSLAYVDSYGVVYDSDYGGYLGKRLDTSFTPSIQTGRCVKLGFPVGHLTRKGSLLLEVTIPALEKSMPEVLPDADLKLAQTELAKQGIEISYSTSTGSGGGGATWVVTKKPEGMSDEEVFQRFFEALGYTRRGPWVFRYIIDIP